MFKEPSEKLHPDHPVLSEARLYSSFLVDAEKPACILVLPGGGYCGVSHQEGPPVAGWLNSLGISAVVLEYSVGSDIYPKPQQQALYAMRYLRCHADRLNIDADRIGVIGFSAGGHLAACVSNGFDREAWHLDPDGELAGVSARPEVSILSYAVLSSGPFAHDGSFDNLLGKSSSVEERAELSWDLHVPDNAPPHFLWHTAEDTCVPVENTYMMAMALSAKKIDHEVHVYPKGAHGIGLGTIGIRRQGRAEGWRNQAESWLLKLGF